MFNDIQQTMLAIVLAPLMASIIAGFFANQVGRRGAHTITIVAVAFSFFLSLLVAGQCLFGHAEPVSVNVYTWAFGGNTFLYTFSIGFLVDPLTSLMLVTVTFVSLLVHIYSIGYMAEDPGYQRFFSYISLFTFAMLMLVSANNFLQLFFGWEAVGLVSYLLIGFWYKKESANRGALKAFLVNRVGDFGFILGIALIFAFVGSLDYLTVFGDRAILRDETLSLWGGVQWPMLTVACVLLFIGAMGKSAQVPLHVWLPESMEGPTPISALIHAATMVTAGVFMVARMSPLFELSETALSVVLVIGATGALFTGLIAVVMNDIKRVIAYSTLSQLGYMMVAMGASAYAAGMFHLLTHAMFKALLFLGAGSVIIAMHHEQDMRKMGGLKKMMPITYWTFLIGALALCAIPPFAGFYSKDMIIEAAHEAVVPGATYAYYCVAIGAFVTALYTFRCLFMTFHGNPRMDEHTKAHVKESPWVVTLPLIALAIPSAILGFLMIGPMLFDKPTLLQNSLYVWPGHDVLAVIGRQYHGPIEMIWHALATPILWLALSGIAAAWLCYVWEPALPAKFARHLSWVYRVLMDKLGFDRFNDWVFVRGTQQLGQFLYGIGDAKVIDGFVNHSSRAVAWVAGRGRLAQTGYLYHYATAMVLGLLIFISWLVFF